MDPALRSTEGFPYLECESLLMQQTLHLAKTASQHDFTVLILRESGTGKELLARWIHHWSHRRQKPFIPLDCASLVPSLIEAELFGHVKGAFTGATHNKQGLIESANGGTLLLDEIGELPLNMQTKFLRALQEREIRPVGATSTIRTNVRIIAATNRNLKSMVDEGTFRQDLYFRLNIIQITLPPLRERKSAIPGLAQVFIEKHLHPGSATGISEAGLRYLKAYDWPGNIRELENAVIRGLSFGSNKVLESCDFDLSLPPIGTPIRACELCTMKEIKDRAIADALRETGGDRAGAARLLGIGKTTIYRKLQVKVPVAS